jgi:hypothetical protein
MDGVHPIAVAPLFGVPRLRGVEPVLPAFPSLEDGLLTRLKAELQTGETPNGQRFSGAFFTSQIIVSGQWFSLRNVPYSFWPFR